MKKFLRTGCLFFGVILLSAVISSCAHKETIDTLVAGHTHGFWSGLLHGFIAPFDFVAMLFSDHIVMYAPNNNGAWYAFGFLLGSGGWGFLGSKGANYNRRRGR
jgi:hypothetical protein